MQDDRGLFEKLTQLQRFENLKTLFKSAKRNVTSMFLEFLF